MRVTIAQQAERVLLARSDGSDALALERAEAYGHPMHALAVGVPELTSPAVAKREEGAAVREHEGVPAARCDGDDTHSA